MLNWQSHIFIHVEGHHVLETDESFLAQLGQMLIESDRRTAGGTTQNKRMVGSGLEVHNFFGNIVCCRYRHLVVVFCNKYAHMNVF